MKILIIHTEKLWYRTPLFNELSKKADIELIYLGTHQKSEYRWLDIPKDDTNYKYTIYNTKGICWGAIKKSIIQDYDVIIIPYMDNRVLKLESLLFCIVGTIRKKKVAYYWEKWINNKQFNTKRDKNKSNVTNVWFKLEAKFIDVFMCPGTKTKKYYLSMGINKDRIKIVRNASELLEQQNLDIRQKHNIDKVNKIILFFGRLTKIKGVDILLQTYAKLNNKLKNTTLLICGEGEEKQTYIDYVKTNKINNVVFAGRVSQSERESYFIQSEVVVFPTKYYRQTEAWCLTINEAMQCGKPIIATKASGAAIDLIIDGVNGFLIDEENTLQLEEKILLLMNDYSLRKKYGENSKRIISNYTYKEQARLILEAIKN